MDMTAPSAPSGVPHPLHQDCQKVSQILARIGEKWRMLVVMLLRDGPRRFNDIKRNTAGISQQMLTRTLRGLERDGIVTRTIYPTSPPQVEYSRPRWAARCRNRCRRLGNGSASISRNSTTPAAGSMNATAKSSGLRDFEAGSEALHIERRSRPHPQCATYQWPLRGAFQSMQRGHGARRFACLQAGAVSLATSKL